MRIAQIYLFNLIEIKKLQLDGLKIQKYLCYYNKRKKNRIKIVMNNKLAFFKIVLI